VALIGFTFAQVSTYLASFYPLRRSVLQVAATVAPSPVASAKLPYYASLTGVRAVAALLVFITHFNPFEESQAAHRWAYTFLHQGHFGVPIFFVLSGFLIATRYRHSVQPSWAWARKYLQNRVARIYPLYFLLTALTFLVYQLRPELDMLGTWQDFKLVDKVTIVVLNFTFLRGFFAYYFFSGISQGWSLTAEETFYALAPFILVSTRQRIGRLVAWAVGLLLFGLALVAVFSPFSHPLRGLFGSVEFMYEWTFFGHSLEFMAGMALALLVAREGERTRAAGWATYGGIAWIVASAAFIATMTTQQAPLTPEHLKILTINYLLPSGICCLFYGLLREQTVVRRLLETKVMEVLGKSSYAFYLIHLGILSVWLKHLGTPTLMSLAITIGLSLALYYGIEEPLQLRLRAKRAR
jgi:peptidoglycan/LPS O-acetylase OafA/YrhL